MYTFSGFFVQTCIFIAQTFSHLSAFHVIGVKRNAERYMFQEPRPPVDAVRARIRESRFSILDAEAVVNFLVTFAANALLDPKMLFGIIFAF